MMQPWIKMRTNLDSDPRVLSLAESLGKDPLHVVGMLWKIWAWADHHSVAGDELPVSDLSFDRLVDCPGFAECLRNVGWLGGRSGRLSLPRFAEHNGQTAKARALSAGRQDRFRKRLASPCNADNADSSRTERYGDVVNGVNRNRVRGRNKRERESGESPDGSVRDSDSGASPRVDLEASTGKSGGSEPPTTSPTLEPALVGLYESVVGITANGHLSEWSRVYPPDWIRAALLATERRKPGKPLAYAARILQEFQRKGGIDEPVSGHVAGRVANEKRAGEALGKFADHPCA